MQAWTVPVLTCPPTPRSSCGSTALGGANAAGDLGSHQAGGSPLEAVDDRRDGERRVCLYEQVNVVRPDLQGVDDHVRLGRHLSDDLLQARVIRWRQDRTPILRAPH